MTCRAGRMKKKGLAHALGRMLLPSPPTSAFRAARTRMIVTIERTSCHDSGFYPSYQPALSSQLSAEWQRAVSLGVSIALMSALLSTMRGLVCCLLGKPLPAAALSMANELLQPVSRAYLCLFSRTGSPPRRTEDPCIFLCSHKAWDSLRRA